MARKQFEPAGSPPCQPGIFGMLAGFENTTFIAREAEGVLVLARSDCAATAVVGRGLLMVSPDWNDEDRASFEDLIFRVLLRKGAPEDYAKRRSAELQASIDAEIAVLLIRGASQSGAV